jgi:hypothetical protein
MKRSILLMLIFTLSVSAFSQSGVKIFGFYREVLPGTIPRGTDENGKAIPKPEVNIEYLIYISGPAKTRIYPVEVWINGERFSASGTLEDHSPVQTTGDLGKIITLVPKTSGTIQRIHTNKPIDGKNFPNAKAKAASNELVLVYKMNGKFYSSALSHLQKIEPVNHQ